MGAAIHPEELVNVDQAFLRPASIAAWLAALKPYETTRGGRWQVRVRVRVRVGVRVRGEGKGLGLGLGRRLHLAHALLGGGDLPRVLGGLQLGLLPLPRLGLVQRSVRGGLQRCVAGPRLSD